MSAPPMLAPEGTEVTALATSQEFGPFARGASITISVTAAAHVNVGADATTSHPMLAAGMHYFTMRVADTVNLIQASSASGTVYES